MTNSRADSRQSLRELIELRARVRMIDTQIIALLARRFDVTRGIGELKARHELPVHDAGREREVLAHCLDLANSMGVPGPLVRRLYEEIFVAVRGAATAGESFPTVP